MTAPNHPANSMPDMSICFSTIKGLRDGNGQPIFQIPIQSRIYGRSSERMSLRKKHPQLLNYGTEFIKSGITSLQNCIIGWRRNVNDDVPKSSKQGP